MFNFFVLITFTTCFFFPIPVTACFFADFFQEKRGAPGVGIVTAGPSRNKEGSDPFLFDGEEGICINKNFRRGVFA